MKLTRRSFLASIPILGTICSAKSVAPILVKPKTPIATPLASAPWSNTYVCIAGQPILAGQFVCHAKDGRVKLAGLNESVLGIALDNAKTDEVFKAVLMQ